MGGVGTGGKIKYLWGIFTLFFSFLSKKRAVQYRFFSHVLLPVDKHTYHTWISII